MTSPLQRGKKSAEAAGTQMVDQVRQIAQYRGARSLVGGGSRPHVTITMDVSDSNRDCSAMLTAIESVTHARFDRGRDFPGNVTEWMLKSKQLVVTLRLTVN